jgi:hypothetical protein
MRIVLVLKLHRMVRFPCIRPFQNCLSSIDGGWLILLMKSEWIVPQLVTMIQLVAVFCTSICLFAGRNAFSSIFIYFNCSCFDESENALDLAQKTSHCKRAE